MRRLSYLLREAMTNVLTNRTTTMVAVATTAFTFACVGIFLLLYVNLRTMANSLEREIQVIVYLQDDLSGSRYCRGRAATSGRSSRRIIALCVQRAGPHRIPETVSRGFAPAPRIGPEPVAGFLCRDGGPSISFFRERQTMGGTDSHDCRRRTSPI